jgi:opacity protein-like surface antigen
MTPGGQSMRTSACTTLCATLMLWLAPVPALAQAAPAAAPGRAVGIQGLVQVARTSFTATGSHDAMFGSATGTFLGGGGRVLLKRGPLRGLFFEGSLDRARRTGERVFVFEGEVSRLGIASTLTITPILGSAGYQFRPVLGRISPYGGGGVGSYLVRESSAFSMPDEDVRLRLHGYHAVGGINVGLSRFFAVGGEARWTTIPARRMGGVYEALGEDDLGGTSLGIRLLVGF